MSSQRTITPGDGPSRRWISGSGGSAPNEAGRLVRRARGGVRKRWTSAGRAAGAGVDQVEAEGLIWALVDAGLARVHERRDSRGDWEPYQWQLTDAGEAYAERWGEALDVDEWLDVDDPDGHETLQNIREWLRQHSGRADPTAVRLIVAIGDEIRAGRVPRGRVLSIRVGGHTKAVRVADYRAQVEEALGTSLEDAVHLHGIAVLAWGPFRFRIDGRSIDGSWSIPWLALTMETLASMTDLQIEATRLLTVENLEPFEAEVRRGLPNDTIAVYTGGFPHRGVISFMCKLCAAGISTVDHWGDIDLGGLRILRRLNEVLPVDVAPFRMEPELLEVLPTRSLTERDREGLEGWLVDPGAPGREIADAMLRLDRKAEQEGWFLLGKE